MFPITRNSWFWLTTAALSFVALLTLAAVTGVWSAVGTSVLAQDTQTYKYSVKYICKEIGPGDVVGPLIDASLTDGKHLTAINVRNVVNAQTGFSLKRVIPKSRDSSGEVSSAVERALDVDQALDIDCIDLVGSALFGSPVPEGIGFLAIESPVELDVVAVYSSEPSGNWSGAWNKVTYSVLPVPLERLSTLELWDKIIFTLKEGVTPSGGGSPEGEGAGGTQVQSPPAPGANPFPGGAPQVNEIYELIVRSNPGFANVKDVVRNELAAAGAVLPPGVDVKIISVEFGVGAAIDLMQSDPCTYDPSFFGGLQPALIYEMIVPAPVKGTPIDLQKLIAALDPNILNPEQVFVCDVEFAIGAPNVDVEYIRPQVLAP